MNVADKDLCEELYKLSGWDDTYFAHTQWYWDRGKPFNKVKPTEDSSCGLNSSFVAPAYGSGYLLRKLGEVTADVDLWNDKMDCSPPETIFMACELQSISYKQQWRVQMQVEDEVLECTLFEADTPENALCKLAIELFKQGVL